MLRHFFVTWCVVATPALAEFKVSISASDEVLGTEDALAVTVQIADPPLGTTVEWPTSPDFELIEKRSSSSTAKSDKGAVTLITEMRTFRPTRKGTLLFGPATVRRAMGAQTPTAQVSVEAIDGHAASAERVKTAQGKEAPLVVPRGAKDFFLNARVSPEAPTLGDPVNVGVSLYVRVGVKVSLIDQITLELPEDSVATELEREASPENVTLGGVEYVEIPLRQVRLMPLSVGTLRLTAATAEVTVGGKKHALASTLPALVVKPASDPRKTFTPDEASAQLRRKAPFIEQVRMKTRMAAPPVMPLKSLRFE